MSFDLAQLNLRKDQVINLKKELGISGQKAEVALALDYSYSMEDEYRTGYCQRAVERLLALGLAFDDNGAIDMYLFHNGVITIPEAITKDNLAGYVNRVTAGKGMGGTSYAPFINQIVADTGCPTPGVQPAKKGLLGGLFGKSTTATIEPPVKLTHPKYVIVITDGDNADKVETEAAMRHASKFGIFWQFVGIGNAGFAFLDKLDNLSGRVIDNANFFKLPNLDNTSDDVLYKSLLKEFPDWIPQARKNDMIL
jgi:hypothetical protein